MSRIPIKIMALVLCVFPVVLQDPKHLLLPACSPNSSGREISFYGVKPDDPVHPTPESPSMASNTINPVHPTPSRKPVRRRSTAMIA